MLPAGPPTGLLSLALSLSKATSRQVDEAPRLSNSQERVFDEWEVSLEAQISAAQSQIQDRTRANTLVVAAVDTHRLLLSRLPTLVF